MGTKFVVYSIRSLQATFEVRASEWMFTGAILSLALVFFLNNTMFLQSSFEGMRSIMNNQAAWAWVLALVGIVRLAVLTINGAYWRTPHLRAATAFLCCGVWFLLCLGFIRNGAMLAAITPWIFLLDAYNVKRASREAGSSELIQRYVKDRQGHSNAGTVARSRG